MSDFFSTLASRARKEQFSIDPEVPRSYLLGFFCGKLIDLLRGIFVFRRPNARIFVGKGTSILCPSKIRSGRFIKFSSGCYVDALSRDGISVGNNFSLGRGASIECTGSLATLGKGFSAGNNVGIGSFSFLGCAGGISIGDDTILGNFVSMHSENHNFERLVWILGRILPPGQRGFTEIARLLRIFRQGVPGCINPVFRKAKVIIPQEKQFQFVHIDACLISHVNFVVVHG